MFQSVGDLGTEDFLSLSFGGRMRRFYVLNIPNTKIRQLQERVRSFPAAPGLTSMPTQAANMFRGGKGSGSGQFDSPTAITIDGSGNFFVADTGNGRIQKFSPTGAFVTTIGTEGNHHESSRPSGVAIDRAGHIYVADAGNHRVQKLAPNGTFGAEWKEAELGFYGPRRIAIGSDDSVYVVDQGHTRVIRFSPDGAVLSTWGSKGTGDGQFDDPTSVAVDSTTNKVYVADPINRRIQIFDSNGKFLAKWSVPEWGQPQGFEDLGVDTKTGRLYASSANMDSILVFDLNGKRVGSLTPKPPERLERPSALALSNGKIYVLNMEANRVSIIDL
jgi:DNA-binding beta-propeller fold protein YncE